MAYNSYVIIDEKIAVIVSSAKSFDMIKNFFVTVFSAMKTVIRVCILNDKSEEE